MFPPSVPHCGTTEDERMNTNFLTRIARIITNSLPQIRTTKDQRMGNAPASGAVRRASRRTFGGARNRTILSYLRVKSSARGPAEPQPGRLRSLFVSTPSSDFGATRNAEDLTSCYEFSEPRFRFAGKFHRPATPEKAHGAGVKGLMRQNEPGTLLRRQAVFDQRQI
jgi:hypothetical protein